MLLDLIVDKLKFASSTKGNLLGRFIELMVLIGQQMTERNCFERFYCVNIKEARFLRFQIGQNVSRRIRKSCQNKKTSTIAETIINYYHE